MTIAAENSRGDNVNEINKLNNEVARLSGAVDWWNSAIIVMMVVAALAATGLLITQYVAFRKAKQLSDVQGSLAQAKDRQAVADSKEKDQKIAAALQTAGESNKAAGEANERAGKANERSSALEVEALRLQEQLVAQGPRENLLRGVSKEKFVESIKPYAGQRIDVRRSASVIEVNGTVVMSTPIGDDTTGLGQALVGALKDGGWDSSPTPLLSAFQGQGLKVEIAPNYSHETLMAATALVKALKEVPLTVEGPLLDTDEQAKRVGKDETLPAFDENTIILTVLAHP